MPRSMTGYGTGEATGPLGKVRAELRGVNGRYLEVRPRIPPVLAAYEADFRKKIAETLARGRVDLLMSWESSKEAPAPFRINEEVAKAYQAAARQLRDGLALSGDLGLVELLAMPGVVEGVRTEAAPPELRDLALAALETAIRAMDAMRKLEGEATSRDIGERLVHLRELREQVASRAESVPQAVKRKIEERLARLGVDTALDPTRLAQEVAYLADRSDIAEELARLDSHLTRTRESLEKTSEPVGKTLEFLAQELHREVNTVGSKCSDLDIAGWVLEMKAEVERIREQVQNLE